MVNRNVKCSVDIEKREKPYSGTGYLIRKRELRKAGRDYQENRKFRSRYTEVKYFNQIAIKQFDR